MSNNFFNNAKWVSAPERTEATFSVLRGHFELKDVKKATLNVIGLGFFKCYINGECVNPDTFLPLSSEYQDGCDPKDEILTARRIYVPQFDITPLVHKGKNTIVIHYGGGWYTYCFRTYGLPKVIYSVCAEDEDGISYYGSDTDCRIGNSFVSGYQLNRHEEHCYSNEDFTSPDFDDSHWDNAVLSEPLVTEYCTTDCPADKLIATIPFKKVKTTDGDIYDCGVNTCGYPVLEINAPKGETVSVYFSEELLPDGDIDEKYIHWQHFTVTSDGVKRTVQPEFTWFAFRCFKVVGNAEVKALKVVHADVGVNSTFSCDNETLNWTYRTFIHTMLTNMHSGHPSDCPHLERRGYTGDGQLTCHAVLSVMDAKAFYEKWLQDIADCQDTVSGHVQYTAPYIRSGGGPGGWGCAIIEVAYQLYKHFGDKSVLEKYYHNMRRYIDYLEAHSEFGLVTSDKEGEWCLGDWCTPVILYPDKDISSNNTKNKQVFLPAPYINTYFMVKSLKYLEEIAEIIGKTEDIAEYKEKQELRIRAIKAAYFNTQDGNFLFGINGANAFGIELGIENQKTYPSLINYYSKLGSMDTGIFGTDVLIRTLFEKGDGELAVDLLTNNCGLGFENWRKNGATTFHEYWDSNHSRSHNHPMFGAPVAYFFEYLLGIKQKKGCAGYDNLVIEPQAMTRFGHMSGSITTPNGVVAVAYKQSQGRFTFTIDIPKGTQGTLRYNGNEYTLSQGTNKIEA